LLIETHGERVQIVPIAMIYERLKLMHDLLAEDGAFMFTVTGDCLVISVWFSMRFLE
jgi:hypothetical protein